MELAPINLNGDQMLWMDLAGNEDKYPLDELYKVVQFGNAENYQKVKKAKIVEKNQHSQAMNCE